MILIMVQFDGKSPEIQRCCGIPSIVAGVYTMPMADVKSPAMSGAFDDEVRF